MLCLAYEEGIELSQNRLQLYNDALDALLQRWDGSRRIHRDDTYKHMTTHRKRALLSYLAAVTFEREQYFISLTDLEDLVCNFIRNLPEVNSHAIKEEARGIIEAIEAHHGLLIRRAKDTYSFSHLTFQEFFTASYVRGRAESQRNLIDNHLGETRWREVLISVAVLLSEADDYVIWILQRMIEMGFTTQYIDLLKSYITQSEGRGRKAGDLIQTITSKQPVGSYFNSDIASAKNLLKKQKALLIGDGLNAFLRRAGDKFVNDATDILTIPVKEEERKRHHVIPRTKKGEIVANMNGAIKRLHEALFERVTDYVEGWIYYYRAACVIHRIEWTGAVSSILKESMEALIDGAGGGAAIRAERQLREVAAVEALLEILESPAYISRLVRETAVKTAAAGRAGLGWRVDAVTPSVVWSP
jgi:hypothetical protein